MPFIVVETIIFVSHLLEKLNVFMTSQIFILNISIPVDKCITEFEGYFGTLN